MQFRAPAPANLTQEGSTLYADWTVASTGHFGYSAAEVESWVALALNDSRGIRAVGIEPRFVSGFASDARVIFQVVETIADSPGAIGIAYWNSVPVLVQLEAAYFGNLDLVTHEALHAFCLASHSPQGSISILEPLEDPGEEWLSAIDIAQLEAWLANTPADTTYWFPGDLEHYITRWIVPPGSQTRLVLTVIRGAPVVVRPVWGTTHSGMLAGNYETFGIGLGANESGFYTSEWRPAPSGELYVGILVEGATPEEFENLTVGLAEVQIAAPTATGGGSPIPN